MAIDEKRHSILPDPEGNSIGSLVKPAMVQLHGAVVHIHAVDELGILLVFITHIVLEDWEVLQDVVLDCGHVGRSNPVLCCAPHKALKVRQRCHKAPTHALDAIHYEAQNSRVL